MTQTPSPASPSASPLPALLWMSPAMQQRCYRQDDLAKLKQAVGGKLTCCDVDTRDEMSQWLLKQDPNTQVLITGWSSPAVTPAMLDHLPNLKLVAHTAGSVRHILPESLGFWKRGIRLMTCNDSLACGVAETTLGMMIAGLKGFDPCATLTRNGGWKNGPVALTGYTPREMFGQTIGLIAASAVGRHVIRLLKSFEVDVLVTDPFLSHEEAAKLGVEKVELMELIRRSVIVSLHAPNLPSTYHMLKAEHFKAMQDQAIFINTARPAIVDEEALTAELSTGRIFAYLDVMMNEPPAADHPLRAMPNVVITPHIAGAISNGCFSMGRQARNAIESYRNGQPIYGEVTEAQAARMA